MTSIQLDLVEPRDLETATALFHAQLREHDIDTSPDDIRDVVRAVISNPRFGFMLLARVDGNAVGVAYAAAHLSVECGGIVGWLEELYVLPEWRNAGAGSRLLSDVINRAENLGWRMLELEIVAGHERAAALYLRHDFQALSRVRYSRTLSRQVGP